MSGASSRTRPSVSGGQASSSAHGLVARNGVLMLVQPMQQVGRPCSRSAGSASGSSSIQVANSPAADGASSDAG